jgi:hypothetical protein
MPSPRWAAASLCLSAALVACAGQPVPGAAVTRLAGSLSAVSARSAASAWAVGQTSSKKTLVLRWNGTSWARVPSPSPGSGSSGSVLAGLTTVSAADAWAAGLSFLGTGAEHTLLLHWNGTSWTQS